MVLYIEGFGGRRIRATEVSEASGPWEAGRWENIRLVGDEVWYEPLEDALVCSEDAALADISGEAFVFAESLAEALDHATLPAGESDTTGRVVVFSDDETNAGGGIPTVEACVSALGLTGTIVETDGTSTNILEESTVEARNWESMLDRGFCHEDEDDDLEDYIDDGDWRKILAATARMAEGLTDHFEFNMSDAVVCAPVLYGGRHNNSNTIVAVLSMRVWT